MPGGPIPTTSLPREATRRSAEAPLRAVLISVYELGRQPFGLASPAAWLERAGAQVDCLDLSVERFDEERIRSAGLIAFHLPMHAATRLAVRAAVRARRLNPSAHLCFYGLYAPMNERLLRRLGAQTILGGEFEEGLESLAHRLMRAGGKGTAQSEPVISLARQRFIVPRRDRLPPLPRYARLIVGGEERVAGYTESSRGCRHRCRHCPVVPVYNGRFRIVERPIVLEDIRRQVEAGAGHITFGDPDFFNAPAHAVALVEALHARHPHVTYDATIKIEHILRHTGALAVLARTGCLFITSAVESIDDHVLAMLDKGHTRRDFVRALSLCREMGLVMHPTFVAFTPWQTFEGYRELLDTVEDLDLVEHVAPIQLSIRLLIPAGSRLLELDEIRRLAGAFDQDRLVHPWAHEDPRVDELWERVREVVGEAGTEGLDRGRTFDRIGACAGRRAASRPRTARSAIPYLTEPWYC